MSPKRGDIFWAKLPENESVGSEQHKDRPVLIYSVDLINLGTPICIIIPLSSKTKKANRFHRIMILESEMIPEKGTKGCKDTVALTEQIRCISKTRLIGPKRIASLKPMSMGAVEAGIKYVLGIP